MVIIIGKRNKDMTNFQIKKSNDKLFKENFFHEMRSEFIKDFIPGEKNRIADFSVLENTVKFTTVDCILKNAGRKMIALNFANAIVAGGAYILGGSAQEESLCRASGLYYTIKQQKAFYRQNRFHVLADYTDGMIFSENVKVIRDSEGNLLETPVFCDFITCPAVNRYESFFLGSKKLDMVMKKRIEKIVSFADSKDAELIIFGAFGCGAFGNKRDKVFPMFEEAIKKYSGAKAEIVFAVP